MPELTPSEALTSHPPSTAEASDEDAIDVTAGEEWVARVEVMRQVVEILCPRMNMEDGKFKTLEETKNICKELEGRQRAEFEMEEAITSLECRLMDVLNTKETITSLESQLTEALSTIETLKAEIKALKEGVDVGGFASPDRDRETMVEAPNPPIFKGVRDAQEVENFLWHLENCFKCSRVRSDENKINTVVLYLSEMAMLWLRRKEVEIGKGTRTINTWEQFREEFKKAFFPNNVVYEVKRKFRELRQTRSIWANVKEFTTLTLQISNLTDEDMLFHFMDALQNWAKTVLERHQVKTIDEAITQAESSTDFKHERHDKAKGRNARSCHAKGGETVAEARSSRHTPSNTTPTSRTSGDSCARIIRRNGRRPAKEMGTTYAVDRTSMPGAPK